MQALLDERHDAHGDDDGDDVTLVADPIEPIQIADDRHEGLNALGRDVVGVLEAGVDERHAHDGPEIRIGPERLGGREANEDLEESERGPGHQIGDAIDEVAGVDGDEPVGVHEVQGAHDAEQQARSDDRRDDGDEDVAEELDGTHEDVLLRRRRLLGLGGARRLDAAHGDEFLIHLVDRARAEDDLQLALGLKHALDPIDRLDSLGIDLAAICDHQAQARGTMRGGHHVAGSPHQMQHLLG